MEIIREEIDPKFDQLAMCYSVLVSASLLTTISIAFNKFANSFYLCGAMSSTGVPLATI